MNHHNHPVSSIQNPVIYLPIRQFDNCREFSTNRPFYAKQSQFPKKSNERKSI